MAAATSAEASWDAGAASAAGARAAADGPPAPSQAAQTAALSQQGEASASAAADDGRHAGSSSGAGLGAIVCDGEGRAFDEELERQLALRGVGDEPAGAQPSSPSASSVREWDIKRKSGAVNSGVNKLTMVLPAVTRVAVSLVGGVLAGTGYAVGKAGEVVGAGKAVDSSIFKAGFISWMYMNGIFPTVKHEPLSSSEQEGLARSLGGNPAVRPEALAHTNMSITPLIVSNHICYLDGMVLAAVFGAPKVVAKSSTKNAPVFGKLMEEMDSVFVEREASESRHKTLDAITEHCNTWQLGSRPLLIFPEGTTTNGEHLIDFKKGAFVAGKPVRPVLIVYTGQFDPATTNYLETEEGLVEFSDAEWAAQFMGHFVHSMHVRVLPPYLPDEREQADAELYARNCRAYMESHLARVRAELNESSWKHAAGRNEGGLGYRFGDVTRIVSRRASTVGSNVFSGASALATGISSGASQGLSSMATSLGATLGCAGPRSRPREERADAAAAAETVDFSDADLAELARAARAAEVRAPGTRG